MPGLGGASSRHHSASASMDSQEAERPRSPDVRAFPAAGGSEMDFWSKTWVGKEAKWKIGVKSSGRSHGAEMDSSLGDRIPTGT